MKKSALGFSSCLLLGAAILLESCGGKAPSAEINGSVPPSEAVATFELEEGFKIELIASEPLISDPVDMEIDEYGRLYVVEMPGYPLDKSGTGKIKMLQDTDGDGVMDKVTLFAEDLTLPNGIMRWKKGFLVTDAPDVLYLEDTNGDGKADKKEVILTGFSLSNPHVNVNNPEYGLDNWIYLAHLGYIGTRKYEAEFGDRGSEIIYAEKPDGPRLPKNANGHTVRFLPEKGKLEMTSTRTQFGHSFDRWGRHILVHNQNHIYHEVIGARYLERNPDLLVPSASESISDHGNEAEVFQITTNPDRQLFTPVGLTTSSSGVIAYLGGLFPPPFDGNVVFGAESVSNLVHVDILEDKGASFVARRHREDKEFLASRDSWSRPANMYLGPDGALYVVDYYRRIIEHPEWMADEAVAEGGLYDGHEMGRIYRVTPTATGKADWMDGLNLGNEKPKEWVQHLSSTNIWWRRNAQRLLVEHKDESVVGELVKMAQNPTSAEGRLHALWTLEGMGKLSPSLIVSSLQDPEAGVRENAIQLAELHLDEDPALAEALLKMEEDPHARVRFQLLCTLGFLDSPEAIKTREALLFKDVEDEWVQIAALSTSSEQAIPLLGSVMEQFREEVPAYSSLLQRLTAMIVGGDNTAESKRLMEQALGGNSHQPAGLQSAILDGFTEGLKRRKELPADLIAIQTPLIEAFFTHPDAAVRNSSLSLLKATGVNDETLLQKNMEKAASIASDRSLDNRKRAEALNFLTLGNITPYSPLLKSLVVPQEEPLVQSRAIQALGRVEGTDVSEYVLEKWATLTPEIRNISLETFLSDDDRIALLLNAIEDNRIPVAAIDWKSRVQLMNNSQEKLREKARALLTKDVGEEVNKKYQKALELKGSLSEGRTVFQKNCAICHQFKGKDGVVFGPDLGTVHNWLPKDLMANILDPNLSIAPGFDLWEVTMKDGEKVQGMIMEETSAAISLRISPGNENTINRQDISSITGLNMSLMPGMADQIDQQEMADLLAFIRQLE